MLNFFVSDIKLQAIYKILLTCQQIGVNTFYKCIEFQVNSFDSYGEILIILKKYPKCLCTVSKQGQITLDIQITGSPALL